MHSGKSSFQIVTSGDLQPGVFVLDAARSWPWRHAPHPTPASRGKTHQATHFPALFQAKTIRASTHDYLAGHTRPSSTPTAQFQQAYTWQQNVLTPTPSFTMRHTSIINSHTSLHSKKHISAHSSSTASSNSILTCKNTQFTPFLPITAATPANFAPTAKYTTAVNESKPRSETKGRVTTAPRIPTASPLT
jgi:hypothetical protein